MVKSTFTFSFNPSSTLCLSPPPQPPVGDGNPRGKLGGHAAQDWLRMLQNPLHAQPVSAARRGSLLAQGEPRHQRAAPRPSCSGQEEPGLGERGSLRRLSRDCRRPWADDHAAPSSPPHSWCLPSMISWSSSIPLCTQQVAEGPVRMRSQRQGDQQGTNVSPGQPHRP